jgi:hypothetical protein
VPVSTYIALGKSVNGSSDTGLCDYTHRKLGTGFEECIHPNTSVLFDGNIPTLTGLDGNMWASQLFATNSYIGCSFASKQLLRRVEVVLFNCPQWGIATSRISISERKFSDYFRTRTISPTLTSCASLIRVCMFINTHTKRLTLSLKPPPGSNWTHLAEVTFYDSNSTCPPDAVLSHPLMRISPSYLITTTSTNTNGEK